MKKSKPKPKKIYINKILKEKVFPEIRKLNINQYREHIIITFLDSECNIIKTEVLTVGGRDSVIPYFNIIFKRAFELEAHYIIKSHNHNVKYINQLEPSEPDEIVLVQLKLTGELLDIDVLCAVIFNEKGYIRHNIRNKELRACRRLLKELSGDKEKPKKAKGKKIKGDKR